MIITLDYATKTIVIHSDKEYNIPATIPNLNFTKTLLEELFNHFKLGEDIKLNLMHDNNVVILGEWNKSHD